MWLCVAVCVCVCVFVCLYVLCVNVWFLLVGVRGCACLCVQYRVAVSGAVTTFSSPAKLSTLLPAIFYPEELCPDAWYSPVVPLMQSPSLTTGPFGRLAIQWLDSALCASVVHRRR